MPKFKNPSDKHDFKPDDKNGGGDPDNKENAAASLNPPRVDPETGKPTQQAVSGWKQAHGIAKNLYQRAREGRLKTAGEIASNYNGKQPYSQDELESAGQGWRNNFSTNFLASIVDRVKPQFLDPIQTSGTITQSILPDDVPDSSKKSQKFRKAITKTIRDWKGWSNFLSLLAQEEILWGNCAPGWLDDGEWRPRAFQYDHAYLPEGSWQEASKLQVVVFCQEWLLHEFLAKIADPEAAETAGYDMPGCCKTANEAAGLEAKTELTPLEHQNRIREQGTFGASYDTAVKYVEVFHLLVREYTGGINLWTVSQKSGHAIRYVENIFKGELDEAVTLFTLQTGDGKFYGSKGLGRLLCNLHIAIEKHRNFGYDNFYLAGMPIATGDLADIQRSVPVVATPFIYLPKPLEISKASTQFDVEGFITMDSHLVKLAESIAGAFIPPNLDNEGSPNTKIEAAEKAEREMAVREGVLGRFFGHFADLVGAMQRKICSVENVKEALRIWESKQEKKQTGFRVIKQTLGKWLKAVLGDEKMKEGKVEIEDVSKLADAESVDCILDLLDYGLSAEEIGMLALSPAGAPANNSADLDAKTIGFIQQKIAEQSPYYDQKEMAAMNAELSITEDRAKRILQKDAEDPTVLAIAQRTQMFELTEMFAGNPMPVAGTDNHLVHRQTMLPKMQPVFQLLQQTPSVQSLGIANLLFNHYASHLQQDKNITPDQRSQEVDMVKGWQDALKKATAVVQTAAKLAQKHGLPPGSLPPGTNGQPGPQVGPDGKVIGQQQQAPPIDPVAAVTLHADVAMHKDNIALENRKLDLQEQQFAHKKAMDVTTHAVDTHTDLAQQAEASRQKGMEDAQAELQQEQEIQAQQNGQQ